MKGVKKRILVLTSASDLYGAGKVVLESVKALTEAGHSVVFAASNDGPLCKEVSDLGCQVEIIPLAVIRRKYFNFKGVLNRINSFIRSWSALNRIVSTHNIDIVYTNTAGIAIGAIYSRRRGLKHLWHIHEIVPGPRILLKFYAHLMRKYCDAVLVVSEAARKHWMSIDSRIAIDLLYNGFDFEVVDAREEFRAELKVSNEILLVGMIARVHFWKGQQYFLEIASHLKSEIKNIKFVMVGDAFPGYEYLYDDIKADIEKLGLKDAVINLGFRTDVHRVLSGLDVFVLPSILPDPLPTTVLEAMVSEKPVVATNHGGAPEMVINNVTGLLVPWDDAEMTAKAILPLLTNSDLRREMGMNGRQRVLKEFSTGTYKRNLLRHIEKL